jgi:antitoxin FitA
MAAVTVRSLSDETHRALKVRAAKHGRSTEAEIRAILEAAVRPKVGMGTALHRLYDQLGQPELRISRDRTPVRKAAFE